MSTQRAMGPLVASAPSRARFMDRAKETVCTHEHEHFLGHMRAHLYDYDTHTHTHEGGAILYALILFICTHARKRTRSDLAAAWRPLCHLLIVHTTLN